MNTNISKIKTSDEIEYEKLLFDLLQLEEILVNKELELSTLNSTLTFFEARYIKIVGEKFSELDDLVAQLLQILANRNPKNKKSQQSAKEAQQRAHESSQASGRAAKKEDIPDNFEPSNDIKKLYHDIAKRIHPDLSTNEEERSFREELMKEVNEAYSSGDILRLQVLLSSIVNSEDYRAQNGIRKQIEVIKMKISKINARITTIDYEINHLIVSDLYQLKLQVDEAENHGMDLLGKMASQVVSRIKRIEQQLYGIIKEQNEWGE